MGTICVTGSASGMGAATAARLRDDGHRVIGVDQRDADVVADLVTADGRAARDRRRRRRLGRRARRPRDVRRPRPAARAGRARC